MILVKLQEKKESQSGERKGSRGGVTYICEKLGERNSLFVAKCKRHS